MNWVKSGNRVASALEVGVCLNIVATWLPHCAAAADSRKSHCDDPRNELGFEEGRALQ